MPYFSSLMLTAAGQRTAFTCRVRNVTEIKYIADWRLGICPALGCTRAPYRLTEAEVRSWDAIGLIGHLEHFTKTTTHPTNIELIFPLAVLHFLKRATDHDNESAYRVQRRDLVS